MNEDGLHPSYLELDRHGLGAAAEPSTAEHVASCARCATYLAGPRTADELPDWLPRAIGLASQARGRSRRGWALGVGGGLALAAAACLVFLWPNTPTPEHYDGVKGAPAVAVYFQRDGTARLWDGSALRPGDRIRLEVMPEELPVISVFSLCGAGKPPLLLYTGRLHPHVASMLPKAWELDAAPGPEQILVILSQTEVSPAAAESLIRARDPRAVWSVIVKLPKQTAPQAETP